MMSEHPEGYLDIGGRESAWFLVWLADGGFGARVGGSHDPTPPGDDLEGGDLEHRVAEHVASIDPTGKWSSTERAVVFVTVKAARACRRRILAEIRVARSGRPWPEWARTALAEGWLPPKGWSHRR